MKRVVVLRPEPGASATVERARLRGLDAFAVPLFEIEPVAWEVPDPSRFDALLLTSANAVRYGGEQLARLRVLPVQAVGSATADAARRVGFEITSVGSSGVDDLLASLEPRLRLLHLCGEHRKVPAGTAPHIDSVVVYRSIEIPAPDTGAVAGGVALIHSPRAGRRLAELVEDRNSIAVAAVSSAAAEAVGTGWETVETAENPSDDALLALAERLCNKHPRT